MREPDLDDPVYAAFAWRRFRTILWWMTLVAAVCAGLSVWWVWWDNGGLHWLAAIPIALGVFFTVLLTAALMGLMFLSSGSGHDARVEDRVTPEIDLDD